MDVVVNLFGRDENKAARPVFAFFVRNAAVTFSREIINQFITFMRMKIYFEITGILSLKIKNNIGIEHKIALICPIGFPFKYL